MVKKEKKSKNENFSVVEPRNQAPILMGFKFGFGFWLSWLTVWLLVLLVAVGLYYILNT